MSKCSVMKLVLFSACFLDCCLNLPVATPHRNNATSSPQYYQQRPNVKTLRNNFAYRSGGSDIIVNFAKPGKRQQKYFKNSTIVKFVIFYDEERRLSTLLQPNSDVVTLADDNNKGNTWQTSLLYAASKLAPSNEIPDEDVGIDDSQEVDDDNVTFSSTSRPSPSGDVFYQHFPSSHHGHHHQQQQDDDEETTTLKTVITSLPLSATIESLCRPSNDDEYRCPIPNVTFLFPNFTANNKEFDGKVILVNNVTNDGSRFFCYGILIDGELMPFPRQQRKYNDAQRRRLHLLTYYPDPIVTSVSLQPPNNLILVSGYGFLMPKVKEELQPRFELVANVPNRNNTIRISYRLTERNSTHFTCLFERSLLMLTSCISKSMLPIMVTVRYGGWSSHQVKLGGLDGLICSSSSIGVQIDSVGVMDDDDSLVVINIGFLEKFLIPISVVALLLILACIGLIFCLQRKRHRRTSSGKQAENRKQAKRFSLGLLPTEMAASLSSYQIDKGRLFLLGKDLGEGFYGKVKAAVLYSPSKNGKKPVSGTRSDPVKMMMMMSSNSNKNMPEKVAVKTIQRYENLERLKELFEEALLTFSFDHPNVLAAIGFVPNLDGCPAIVLPMMVGGNLYEFVRTSDELNDAMIYDFGWQIAKGMSYLASLKLVHRDLAARNCLLDQYNVVKVADFGLTRHLESTSYEYGTFEYKMLSFQRPLPIRWLAPECLANFAFSEKSDVWSFGVLLWELATRGERPYGNIKDSNNVIAFVRYENGRLPQMPNMADELYELMLSCWNEHSSERPTFDQLVNLTKTLLDSQCQEDDDYCDPNLYIVIKPTRSLPLEGHNSCCNDDDEQNNNGPNRTDSAFVDCDESNNNDDSFDGDDNNSDAKAENNRLLLTSSI